MDRILRNIKDCITPLKPSRILVACSAGLDSTVLLRACHQLNLPVEIAHVNYQLRGADSNADELFLFNLSQELSIPFHLKRIDLKAALEKGGNLQEKARIGRYSFFQELLKSEPNSVILLAHHKEDQTETFFMNLARNSGVMGLAGIPVSRGKFIRPLLSSSKEELRTFAKKNNIRWREDASNESLKYTRNEWRNVILPELRSEIPSLDNSVAILTKAFQDKQINLERKIQSIVQEIQETHVITVHSFKALDEFEQIELCRQLEQPFGILKTWRKLDHKGTGIDLHTSHSFPFHKMIFDGNCYSFIGAIPTTKPKVRQEMAASLPSVFDKSIIYLDGQKIDGELRFRPVKTGDRIHPIGMKGSRLVSDVISDAKLSSIEKQQLHVLTDDFHILWVPELVVSRKAIAGPNSSEILKVSLVVQ